MIEPDVCILGAGPGGVAAALQLDRLGVDCLLIDKAVFPRDKVCGDAISGKTVWAFNRIDEAIFKEFRGLDEKKINCWGISFIFSNGRDLSVPYKPNLSALDLSVEKPVGYVSKRIAFDNFLVEQVKKSTHIQLLENVNYTDIREEADGIHLSGKDAEDIKAKVVIVANGALSQVARKLGGLQIEKKHHCGAIRAYMKNVKGMNEYNFIELHFLKEFTPGYLWIFPLPNGDANVGAGMRSDLLGKKKVNLKAALDRLIKEHPRFKDRFAEAEYDGPVQGFPLPLGSKKRKISGNRFLLVGDAASLIDPLTGEGIGNAATSGFLAARHVAEALHQNEFSANTFKKYDAEVYKYLWKELQISTQLQRAFLYPWLVTLTSSIALRNQRFTEIITSMFTDVDVRKKLLSPAFYFRLLLNR
ncbi:MAG: geranylgeranyl reductase family protein [Cyclobacteriaceae bacterium]|nr:geranylgeranyl reductase family protein [Cyclobacteriaceae bacterium]